MKAIGFVLLLIVLAILVVPVVVDEIQVDKGHLWSRNIGCDGGYSEKAQKICHRLEQELQWSWLGHAIIAPGWRLTDETVRQVYCREKISLNDMPALREIEGYKPFHPLDERLEVGALTLLALLRTSPEGRKANLPDSDYDDHTAGIYGISSIGIGPGTRFDPASSNYILHGGCAAIAGKPD